MIADLVITISAEAVHVAGDFSIPVSLLSAGAGAAAAGAIPGGWWLWSRWQARQRQRDAGAGV